MSPARPHEAANFRPSSIDRRTLLALLAASGAAAVAGCAGLAGTPASASDNAGDADALPPPQPAQPLRLPPLSQRRLANGVELLVAHQPRLPLVSATLLVRAGTEFEPAGRSGVAEMTATLLTKGTLRDGRPVSASELARQAEALGGTLDGGGGFGTSSVGMTVTTPRLPQALALLADVLRRPLLAEEELERARAQALDALRVAYSEPGQVAAMALRRSWWGASPYGGVATPASLERLRRADLQDFHARGFQPGRCALVLAGDISADAAQALAQQVLGDWRAAAPAWPPQPPAQPRPAAPPLLLIDLPGSGQSAVAVAAPAVGTRSAERRIGQVAQAVLGPGYSARLNQEVRIKRGLSYGVGAGTTAYAESGLLSASAQTRHASAVEVLQLLRTQISQLADHPPSATELAARQATLVGSFARSLDTTAELAGLLAAQWSRERPIDELQRYEAEVMAVTPQQVADFARRHWAESALRAVVVGDLTAAGAALPAAGEGVLRLPLAELDLECAGVKSCLLPQPPQSPG